VKKKRTLGGELGEKRGYLGWLVVGFCCTESDPFGGSQGLRGWSIVERVAIETFRGAKKHQKRLPKIQKSFAQWIAKFFF